MFGLSGLKMGLFAFGAIAVVTIIGLIWNHYTNLLETVKILGENAVKLEAALVEQGTTIDEQETAIDEWETSQETLVNRMGEFQEVSWQASKERRRLDDLFAKHDFTFLTRENPGRIELRINRGTAREQRLLECASGAQYPDCPDRYKTARPEAQPAGSGPD